MLCPAVEEGVNPLLAVWPGQVLPLQWQHCSAVKGPWWQAQSSLAYTYSELKRQKPEALGASPRSGRLAVSGLPARGAVWAEVILHCPLGDGLEGGGGSSHLLPTQPACFLPAATLEAFSPYRRCAQSHLSSWLNRHPS